MKRSGTGVVVALALRSAGAQTVTIDPMTQRFIGGVSELDRSKFFKLHSGDTSDPDLLRFYEDYGVSPGRFFWGPFAYATSKTGVVGEYPVVLPNKADESGVVIRNVSAGLVSTEHPRNVIRYDLDETVAADYVAEYFLSNENVPEYYEPMNEPFVHAGDAVFREQQPDANLMRRRMAEWFAAIGEKIHGTPDLAKMKVLGYSSAWPSFEVGNFGHWVSRQKMFMDVAGAHMDAFATHLYDGVNVAGTPSERSGSNSEAILDMIEAYSFLTFGGVVKPHAITEYGGIASGYPSGWNDVEAVQSVSSSNKLLFNLLDRGEARVAVSIPFITDKSQWHLTAANQYEPYGAVLLRPTNLGEPTPRGWVYTPKILFYEMWRDVRGHRVHVHSDHPDIQVHAFVDGPKLYLALNNLDDHDHNVTLAFVDNNGKATPDLTSVRVKRLRIYADKPHEFTDDVSRSSHDANSTPLTLVADETAVLEYTYEAAVVLGGEKNSKAIRSEVYYADTYLEPIVKDQTTWFSFSGVQTGSAGFTKLKMGLGRSHDASKTPAVVVNGVAVAVPGNWKGYDQANRNHGFFGVIDIPVPMSLVQSTTTVGVTFPDESGGYTTSLLLEVAKFDDDDDTAKQTPFGGSARAVTSTIQAEDFDDGGQGVAYYDTDSANAGGQGRPDEAVDLQIADDQEGGGLNVGWTATGEWLEYTVNADEGTYRVEARVASALADPGDLNFSLDGQDLCDVVVHGTGGWQTWQTAQSDRTVAVPVAVVNGVLRVTIVRGGGVNLNWFRFTAANWETATPTAEPTTTKTTAGPTTTPPLNAVVSEFILINGRTDREVATFSRDGVVLYDGSHFDPSAANVVAVTTGDGVGSVIFDLEDTTRRTENVAPYALFGDDGRGDFYAGSLAVGESYTLTATPFTGSGGSGLAGTPLVVNFVLEETSASPTPSSPKPTAAPTRAPTAKPTEAPTDAPTAKPTGSSGGGGNTTTPPSGATLLEFRHSGKCFDLAGGNTANQAYYQQWTCWSGNANQQLTFKNLGAGFYSIKVAASDKCVDLDHGGTADGAKIHQWDCMDGNLNQHWRILPTDGGWVELRARKSDKCIDIADDALLLENGGKVQQMTCSGRWKHQLKFRY
mmetsp:Transcript_2568/g.8611  ORF Transcript_2568/g.8611 Transcript_2568/m.8611 type:complete len:1123 (-) Transcript_2568:414-3782(-)